MNVVTIQKPQPIITGAEFERNTSFGAVYRGEIYHEEMGSSEPRSNYFVETVPSTLLIPDSAIVICGGYTSSEEHYTGVQKELGLKGERSVYVGHNKHKGYEIGHNAEDIAYTCEQLAIGGVKKIVLLGHSRGAPEALEAHQIIRERGIEVEVTDIVLAFPAQFINDKFALELVKNSPKFLVESLHGFARNPVKQTKFTLQILRNVFVDLERTAKEGWHLLNNAKGSNLYDEVYAAENRPRLHLVVGLFDGLVPGQEILKSFEDKEHDSLTVLKTGHIEMNLLPDITNIIHKRVRQLQEDIAA
jgi:pimeloyl-ACP methyl ester carboxylesterase